MNEISMNQKINYIIKNKDKIRPVEFEAFLLHKQSFDSATKGINALYDRVKANEKDTEVER